ncbi:unnamed protein product, partial [Iphiclides podalirius]
MARTSANFSTGMTYGNDELVRVQGVSIAASEDLGIPEFERLLPSYLRELGYETCLIGKWNVGKSREHYLPNHRGFNTFYGFLDGSIDYYTYDLIETWNGDIAYGLNLYNNTEPVEDQIGHITEVFTDKAVHIIQNHNSTYPLYLHLSHAAPHVGGGMVNLQTPTDTIAANSHIAHSARRMYAGMVTGLDKSVGRVVAALSERGMLQNTIIVIVSDNGALTTGALQNFGSNFPLRGVKGTPWEGALRSPALIWHPLLPSTTWRGLFHVTDWVPTLLSAAGGSIATHIDGIDQWFSLKNGEKPKRKNALLALDSLNGWLAFREGDLKIIIGQHNHSWDAAAMTVRLAVATVACVSGKEHAARDLRQRVDASRGMPRHLTPRVASLRSHTVAQSNSNVSGARISALYSQNSGCRSVPLPWVG